VPWMGFRPSGLLAGCYIGGPQKKRREKIACAYYEWEFLGFFGRQRALKTAFGLWWWGGRGSGGGQM